MRKEDFKEITAEHIEFCKKVVENGGLCADICLKCPFSIYNSVHNKNCDKDYSTGDLPADKIDERLLESVKEFLKMVLDDMDNVNSPNHYKLKGLEIEVIDVIRACMTEEEFRGYCKGNVIKYVMREGKKNGTEDLRKAKRYLEYAVGDDK